MSAFRFNIKLETFSAELIFCLYFWGFILLRPLIYYFESISTLILFIYTLVLFFLSMSVNKKFTLKRDLLLIAILIFSVFIFDLLFRRNDFTLKYLYEFIIYGIIPFYFLSQVENPGKLLEYFSKISVFAFLLLGWSPLFPRLEIFSDYMDYGFNLVLPSFFGIHLGRKVLKKRWLVPVEIISLATALFFSNRSVILNIALFFVLVHLYLKPTLNGKLFFLVTLSFIIIVCSFFIEDFVNGARLLLERNGYRTYSMAKLSEFFSSDNSSTFFSGRIEIWEEAQSMIKSNILFGSGTGAFQATYGKYPHNLYFDVMTQYGIIGIFFLLFLIILSLIKTFTLNGYTKLLGITFLCMWFPKLFLSLYLYSDIGIWCFIAFAFLRLKNNNQPNLNAELSYPE